MTSSDLYWRSMLWTAHCSGNTNLVGVTDMLCHFNLASYNTSLQHLRAQQHEEQPTQASTHV